MPPQSFATGSRRRRRRPADTVIAAVATATQAAAPTSETRRDEVSAGDVESVVRVTDSGDGDFRGGAPSAVTAANASTTPRPTQGSHPAAGWCAVSVILRITCRAVSSGATERTNATMPATTGAE